MIGDHIEVVVLENKGEQVKLGIKAPKEIEVYRQEIYESVKQTNKEASQSVIHLGSMEHLMKKISEKPKK